MMDDNKVLSKKIGGKLFLNTGFIAQDDVQRDKFIKMATKEKSSPLQIKQLLSTFMSCKQLVNKKKLLEKSGREYRITKDKMKDWGEFYRLWVRK
jgi:hypothetical protein